MVTKTEIRLVTRITGILAAVIILTFPLFNFGKAVQSKKETKTELHAGPSSNANDANSEGDIKLDSSPLRTSTTPAGFQQQGFSHFEIIFAEKDVEPQALGVSFPLSKFFQTLFSTLISPNAP
jgi:hypothetical protein